MTSPFSRLGLGSQWAHVDIDKSPTLVLLFFTGSAAAKSANPINYQLAQRVHSRQGLVVVRRQYLFCYFFPQTALFSAGIAATAQRKPTTLNPALWRIAHAARNVRQLTCA